MRADILAALNAETNALAAAMASHPADAYDRPSPCAPWSVRELLAHMLRASLRLSVILEQPAPTEPRDSALQYFRHDRRGGGSDAGAIEEAQQAASNLGSGEEIVAAITNAVRDMIEHAEKESVDRVVQTPWDDVMSLDEYLKTRVFELVVHGLDLASALGHEPWTSQRGAVVTVEILTEDLDDQLLTTLGWNPTTLIAKATGRLPLTEDEAAQPWRSMLLWPRVAEKPAPD